MPRPIAICGLLLAVSVAALAEEFPEYSQFRYISGLAGSGYGVDHGEPCLEGGSQTYGPADR